MSILTYDNAEVNPQPIVPALFTPEQARKHDAVRAFIYDCIWGRRADWPLDAVKGWLITPEDEGGFGLNEVGIELWEKTLISLRKRQAIVELLSYAYDHGVDDYHPAIVQAEKALAAWEHEPPMGFFEDEVTA